MGEHRPVTAHALLDRCRLLTMPARRDDSLSALFGGFWTGALVIAGAGTVLYLTSAVPRWIGYGPLAAAVGVVLACACACLGPVALAILGRITRAQTRDRDQIAFVAGAVLGIAGAVVYGFVEVFPKIME